MEVYFSQDVETRLSRVAAERGRPPEAMVQEAVLRLFDYDQWFVRGVEKGLAAAERGEWVDHSEIRKLIDSQYPY